MTDRSRWIALVVLCTGMLMIVLDMTIVNVALPSIQADLGFSQASLAWVVNAYLIAFAGLLLLAGRLGDLAGRRRVFLAGLAVFSAASLLCGLAASQDMLIAARFLQGIGGALTSAVILGMIVTMFPDLREQARAVGVFACVASAGAAVGLLAGGVLTQLLNWHWIFFVNLPIGAVTAVAARRLIRLSAGRPAGRRRRARRPADHRRDDARRVHDRGPGRAAGVAGGQDAHPRRLLAGAAGGLPRQAAHRPPPADATADPGRARRRRGQPGPGAGQRGHVRDVLPRVALPAADSRLRPAPDRAGVPAGRDRDGRPVRPVHRPAGHAVRLARGDDERPGPDRGGPGPVRGRPGGRRLPAAHLPGHGADRGPGRGCASRR